MTEVFRDMLNLVLIYIGAMLGCLSLFCAAYIMYAKEEDTKQRYDIYLKVSLIGTIACLILSLF